MTSRQRSDLVLVHGSTQSPAGFDRLRTALHEHGLGTFAPTIRAGAEAGVADHVAALAEQIPAHLQGPIVLAHSAAGLLLLPALAQHLEARHQLWLAAAVADYTGGRSFVAEVQTDPSLVLNSEWIGVDPTGDRGLAAYFLFHDADLAGLRHGLDTLQLTDLSGIAAEAPTHDPAALPCSPSRTGRCGRSGCAPSPATASEPNRSSSMVGATSTPAGRPVLTADALLAAL